MSVTPDLKQQIRESLGSTSSIITDTVAQLYIASPNPEEWSYTNIMGALCFIKDRSLNTSVFKIFHLDSCECIFECVPPRSSSRVVW
jgi:hypothetical protein